jgi:uncharacterized protein YbbC (DUF1343 family)
VLASQGFAPLKGKKVGIITNHTGLSRDGKRNIDLMKAAGVDIKAIFSPEHGLYGKEDHENIGNAKEPTTGAIVYSLYAGENRRPSPESLAGLDLLIFDIQDVGARFYTYPCTMLNSMEEAAQRKLKFMVLDRPNPITGLHVEGPVLEAPEKSFIGCFPGMPLRHGLTIGELAKMFNESLPVKAQLDVVPMQNWRRSFWFDTTGLPWINLSPNMRSLSAATLYPAISMYEYSKNLSVGRGTDSPIEQVGADWIDGVQLARHLNESQVPGVRAYPTQFKPDASYFAGQLISGVRFILTDRDRFDSARLGLELGSAFAKLYPGKIDFAVNNRLIGSKDVTRRLTAGESANAIEESYKAKLQEFLRKREQFLMYQ